MTEKNSGEKSGEIRINKKKLVKGMSHPFWAISAIVLAVLLIIILINGGSTSTSSTTSAVSLEEAKQSLIDFASSNGAQINVVDSKEEGDFYVFTVDVNGQKAPVYVTKDGKNLAQLFPINGEVKEANSDNVNVKNAQATAPKASVSKKSDRPKVELFVMSHCPYGTQTEKGILPVVTLLKDKIDFEVKFVYYAMHGEKEVYEELNQYCIQKEQNDKYLNYLNCFLEDGDGERCIDAVGIDKEKLASCTSSADEEFEVTKNFEDQSSWLSGRFPLVNLYKEDNEKYGVQGSPTLIINGEEVRSGRDSASLLSVICSAFNNPPEECSTEFESASPSPGFGFGTSESNNNQIAGCGY